MTDQCGYDKDNGQPCELPGSRSDGRCHHHTAVDAEQAREGRPSKFDDERARQAIQAARESKSKAGCARAAGIGKATLERWLESNPEFTAADGTSVDFRNSFRRARSKGETLLVQGGLTNDNVDSQMARFLLSTSFDYVKTEKHEVTGEDGGAIDIALNETVVETPHSQDQDGDSEDA